MLGLLRTETPVGGDEPYTESDADLVARAIDDPRAFALLYRRYVGPVYRYCHRRLSTREAAEDATQQIFEKVLAALQRYDDRDHAGSFRGWLFAIAHHTLTDRHRTARPTQPLATAAEVIDDAPTPEEESLRAEAGREVRALLARLGDDERRLLELRLAGLNDAEIARLLGRSHGSIRTMQYRTVARLRTLLGIVPAPKETRDAQT